jgi:methylated-DNA-[protein]-cysteine S-methyltransferase
MPSTRFPTTIGECTISWDANGLTGLALPDPSAHSGATAEHPPAAADCPPAITALIARIQRHLAGELQDFSDLPYDWARVTPFQQRVLRALLAIGPGRTATYGDLARAINAAPGAARAIGGAVGSNPWPLLIPCHRILGSTGKLTGYSAPGGVRTKAKLLALEGVQLAVV